MSFYVKNTYLNSTRVFHLISLLKWNKHDIVTKRRCNNKHPLHSRRRNIVLTLKIWRSDKFALSVFPWSFVFVYLMYVPKLTIQNFYIYGNSDKKQKQQKQLPKMFLQKIVRDKLMKTLKNSYGNIIIKAPLLWSCELLTRNFTHYSWCSSTISTNSQNTRESSLVFVNLLSENKASQFESSNWLCVDVSCCNHFANVFLKLVDVVERSENWGGERTPGQEKNRNSSQEIFCKNSCWLVVKGY